MRTRGKELRRPREQAPTYNVLKRKWQDVVALYARTAARPCGLPPADVRKRFAFRWWEPDKKRDPDGVGAGGAKIILDGLIDAGILAGDGAREVLTISHGFVYEGYPQVEVWIRWTQGMGVLNVEAHWFVTIPVRFPDLNELLAARELGARISQARRRAR